MAMDGWIEEERVREWTWMLGIGGWIKAMLEKVDKPLWGTF